MDKTFFSCVSFFMTLLEDRDGTLIFRSSSIQPLISVSQRMKRHDFDAEKWRAVNNKYNHPNPIASLWKYEM